MAQQADKMYRVYTIVERPKQDDYWLNIGAALASASLTLVLWANALPPSSAITRDENTIRPANLPIFGSSFSSLSLLALPCRLAWVANALEFTHPCGIDRLLPSVRHVLGVLDQFHLRDITRAVWEDRSRLHANDELCTDRA